MTDGTNVKNRRWATWVNAGLLLKGENPDVSCVEVYKSHSECQKLPDLLRVWDEAATPVGRSLVDSIHHGFPIHRVPREGCDSAAGKGGLALYRYEGFFRVKKAGQYSFATASNWGSYLLIGG